MVFLVTSEGGIAVRAVGLHFGSQQCCFISTQMGLKSLVADSKPRSYYRAFPGDDQESSKERKRTGEPRPGQRKKTVWDFRDFTDSKHRRQNSVVVCNKAINCVVTTHR